MNRDNSIQVLRTRIINSTYRNLPDNGYAYCYQIKDIFFDFVRRNEKIAENTYPPETLRLREGPAKEELDKLIEEQNWRPNTIITQVSQTRMFIRRQPE